MKAYKLVRYLQSLSAKELKKLELFINSKFFNSNKRVVRLLKYLKENGFDFNKLVDRKREIFQRTMGKSKYNNQKLYNLYYQMAKLIEYFLSVNRFISDDKEIRLNLIQALIQRNLMPQYSFLYPKMEAELKGISDNSADNLFYKYKFYFVHHLSNQSNYLNGDYDIVGGRTRIDSLLTILNYLDKFYLLSKLELCSEIALREYWNDTKYMHEGVDIPDPSTLLKSEYLPPSIKIYYNLYKIGLKDNTDHYFRETLRLLKKHEKDVNPSDLFDIYTKLQNVCIYKINNGYYSYIPLLFRLYKKTFEPYGKRSIVTNTPYLDPLIFMNAVATAISVNKLRWAYRFNEEFKSKVEPNDSNNSYMLNKARIFFYMKKLQQCLQILNKIEYKNIFVKLISKSLFIMAYYELGDTTRFEYSVDAFKHFLKRNKLITDLTREMGHNFIKFSTKLMKAKISNNFHTISSIRDQIIHSKVANRKWLLDKVSELSNSYI